MAIDYELIRSLVHKAETEAPFEISPLLPAAKMSEPDSPEGFSMSFEIPKDEGKDFKHWRIISDLEFVRVSHDGRPGFAKTGTRVEGLTAKGEEFAELSRNNDVWTSVVARCASAGVMTMPIILSELRKEARSRLSKK